MNRTEVTNENSDEKAVITMEKYELFKQFIYLTEAIS